MKKSLKLILIIVGVLLGIILLDTGQAIIFKNSPFISWKENLEDNDSWVYKGILMDTYYCTKESDIVTVSWHFKTSKFTCPVDNEELKYDGYRKVSTITADKVDTNMLVMFSGILYGKSYAIIDYAGDGELIGIIDKLIDYEYVPKLDGETNTKEILNASVFDQTDKTIVLLYNNEYVLFEKING